MLVWMLYGVDVMLCLCMCTCACMGYVGAYVYDRRAWIFDRYLSVYVYACVCVYADVM